jgi:hypothetical protein
LDDAEILDGVLVLGSAFGSSWLSTLLLVVVAGLGILSERGGDDACDISGDLFNCWTSEFASLPSSIGEAAAD